MMTKDQTAQFLADAHFQLDQDIARIFRLVAPDESSSQSPVKLLEVNSTTPETGIMPVGLGADPGRGILFASVIVEVSPVELQRLLRGELRLPHGWQLGSELFPSHQPTGAVP